MIFGSLCITDGGQGNTGFLVLRIESVVILYLLPIEGLIILGDIAVENMSDLLILNTVIQQC